MSNTLDIGSTLCPPGWRGLADRKEKGLHGFLSRHSVTVAVPDGWFYTGTFDDTLYTAGWWSRLCWIGGIVVVVALNSARKRNWRTLERGGLHLGRYNPKQNIEKSLHFPACCLVHETTPWWLLMLQAESSRQQQTRLIFIPSGEDANGLVTFDVVWSLWAREYPLHREYCLFISTTWESVIFSSMIGNIFFNDYSL